MGLLVFPALKNVYLIEVKVKNIYILFLLLAIFVTGCKKDDSTVQPAAASSGEGPTVADGTITSSGLTSTGVTLTWNKGADQTTAATALTYSVYQSTTDNLSAVSVTDIEANGTLIGAPLTDTNTLTVTGLTAETAYFYNVVVANEAKGKTAYTGVSITTTKTPATTYTVSGYVNDTATSTGLAGVKVTVGTSTTLTATTDSTGFYTLTGVVSGTHTLNYTKTGYDLGTASVTVNGANLTTTPIAVAVTVPKYTVSGYVNDSANSSALTGVVVTVASNTSLTATTDSTGFYSITGVSDGTYTLNFAKTGYDGATSSATVSGAALTATAVPMTQTVTYKITGYIYNSTTGLGLAGATVTVVSNSSLTATTDANGLYTINGAAPGSYTLNITLAGYTFSTVVVVVGSADAVASKVNLSATLPSGQFRFVLTWGAAPADLDLYSRMPDATVINYTVKTGTGISLDVDQQTGYGPETISISAVQTGTYTFYVHNFTGSGDFAGANLKIYNSAGLMHSIDAGSSALAYWNLGTFNGTTFTISNTFGAAAP